MEKMIGRAVATSFKRIPNRVPHQRASQKFFSSSPRPSEADEAKRLSDQARASQNLWDFMVPERNMGVTHPFFLVLLVLTLGLHFYNNHRDAQEDEVLRKRRLERSSTRSTS